MKAVILAAGKGTRMKPLTDKTPKPLLKILGKTLLDHVLQSLPPAIDEVFIIVSYLKEQVIEHIAKNYSNFRIHFIEQLECNGTAKALELAMPHLGKEKFLLMNSDDIHPRDVIAKACTFDLAMLAYEAEHPERFGVIDLQEDVELRRQGALGRMRRVIEKPEHPATNLVNVGVHVLDYRVFNYPMRQHGNGEYYLTDLIDQLAQDVPVAVVKSDLWIPIGYPEDLKMAEEKIKNRSHPLG